MFIKLLPRINKKYGFFKFIHTIHRRNLTMDNQFIFESVKTCIPPLDFSSHKGQAGRIGVVGGSLEYTGAPYFAGISALKVGADLVHIFCVSLAATVIKSYSPELIVHPLLDHPQAVTEISKWLDRLHVIVIGPGLGREPQTFNIVSELIKTIRDRRIPLVIDADGLFLITEKPDLIKDFPAPVVLTPNKIEFERLSNKFNGTAELCKLGKNVIILKKGQPDEVLCTNSEVQWKSDKGGSPRRCGGQGDLLSGSIATFLHWTLSHGNNVKIGEANDKPVVAASLAAFAGTRLVRVCNEKAFRVKGRSMLATDMIDHIHDSFEELFGN